MLSFFRNLKNFVLDIWYKKKLILALSLNDFKKRYSTSYLGLFWSFAQPLINIGVFWVVFTVGFRAADIEEGIPFILWLVCGLIPWYFFSDVFNSGSNILFEYSYMLKQMVFKPSILPIIKIISNSITHLFFIFIILIIRIGYGLEFSVYNLQVIYYFLCLVYFLIGICWLFSSIKVFLPDTGEIITVILQLGMWLTPVIWNVKMVPDKYKWIFKLNPMFYIVDGYRDSFIYKVWFWEKPKWTLLYFFITTIVVILGIMIFRRLQTHFNDVL